MYRICVDVLAYLVKAAVDFHKVLQLIIFLTTQHFFT